MPPGIVPMLYTILIPGPHTNGCQDAPSIGFFKIKNAKVIPANASLPSKQEKIMFFIRADTTINQSKLTAILLNKFYNFKK